MSGFYSDEVLEEIKNANDIVDVVSEYVKLKRSGRSYFGLCPFHNEKTPSFSVSPDKQIFYCFGCNIGGNVIHFITKIENLDFVESLRHLADRARIQLPEGNYDSTQLEKNKLKENILQINIEAARYLYNNLSSSQALVAREYLIKRGISAEIIKKFGIGFAYGIKDDLCNFLKAKGFLEQDILASGVAYKDKANKLHDKFKARVMFPILDVRDRVIGFGGRVLDNSLPKYLNSPETIVFNKRRNLYGINLAKKSSEKIVIVVEGYMDAISLYQFGLTNVTASLGTAFTQEQGRLLRKYFDEVVMAFDSDAAGQNAALRSIDLLNDMEIPVRIIRLSEAKDPDEFIRKKGVKLFKEEVSAAKSLAEFKIEILKGQFDLQDTRGKIGFLNSMAAVLAKVHNNIERDAYIKQISQETGIGVQPIYAEINKLLNGKIRALKIPKNAAIEVRKYNKDTKDDNQKIIQAERMLIALLSLNNRKLFEYITRTINIQDFYLDMNIKLAKVIFNLYEQRQDVTYSDILNNLETDNEISVYTEIIHQEYNFDDTFKVADDLLETIKRGKYESRKKEILAEMRNENLSKGDVERLEQELKNIMFALQAMKKN